MNQILQRDSFILYILIPTFVPIPNPIFFLFFNNFSDNYRLVCFELEEFETAKKSFEAALQLLNKTKDNSLLKRWIRKCDIEITGEIFHVH